MSDEQEKIDERVAGMVEVQVSARAVHKAVQNILKNECNVDPLQIREEVRNQAFELVRTEVIARLEKTGYGEIGLKDWAYRSMKAHMEKEFKDVVKQVVRELVTEHIREQVLEVVAVLIEKGVELNIGWRRKVQVSLKEKELT